MNRRKAIAMLGGGGGIAVASAHSALAASTAASSIPNAVEIQFDKLIVLPAKSNIAPGGVGPVMTTGKGTFHLDEESRLTATIHAGVSQYSKCELWLYAAVFDAAGRLLGAANHKESIEYVRLGVMPTILREIVLDFGVSKSFVHAKLVALSICDRDIPKAPA